MVDLLWQESCPALGQKLLGYGDNHGTLSPMLTFCGAVCPSQTCRLFARICIRTCSDDTTGSVLCVRRSAPTCEISLTQELMVTENGNLAKHFNKEAGNPGDTTNAKHGVGLMHVGS